jgi:23S rRNA pseudouridine1911/1915/1917 synthase
VRVGADLAGRRLDQALAALLPEFSRGRLQEWIVQGRVRVDGEHRRRRDRVWGGEEVRIEAQLYSRRECTPESIALDIVYEDEELLVVNKPAGLVVHPAAGNPSGTLQNALLHHAPALDQLPRGGIVHRLDKDTSGLLVVAKTPTAHRSLVDQLQRRDVHREYRALVQGTLVAGGSVDQPIGRHPLHRTRMAVVAKGRRAVSHFRILERFAAHTLLSVGLETGRTHQIRVHMAYIQHPLVGDKAYGGRPRPPKGASLELIGALAGFPRQALHAIRLGIRHPKTGRPVVWEVAMAEDLDRLLSLLRAETGRALD